MFPFGRGSQQPVVDAPRQALVAFQAKERKSEHQLSSAAAALFRWILQQFPELFSFPFFHDSLFLYAPELPASPVTSLSAANRRSLALRKERCQKNQRRKKPGGHNESNHSISQTLDRGPHLLSLGSRPPLALHAPI